MSQTMTRDKFLSQLRHHLRRLPAEEIDSAITYYEEYLDDAGEENLQAALDSLDSPREVAIRIMSERIEDMPPSMNKGVSAVWVVVLGILSAPITLPLALTGVVLALALILVIVILVFAMAVVLCSLVFSLVLTGAALLLGGLWNIVLGFMVLGQSMGTAIYYMGTGLCAIGLAVVLWPAILWVIRNLGKMLKRLFGTLPAVITKLYPGRYKK